MGIFGSTGLRACEPSFQEIVLITLDDHPKNYSFQSEGIKTGISLAVMHPSATIQARHAVTLQDDILALFNIDTGLHSDHTGETPVPPKTLYTTTIKLFLRVP
jgi:hypothetical protein